MGRCLPHARGEPAWMTFIRVSVLQGTLLSRLHRGSASGTEHPSPVATPLVGVRRVAVADRVRAASDRQDTGSSSMPREV